MFDRLAGTWTYWGWKGGYFDSRGGRPRVLRRALLHAGDADGGAELAAVVQHRPALGLRHRRPGQGHFYVDSRPAKLTKSKSAYEHPQPHACFIQSVNDDLVNDGGIMDLWVREARLFKYGSGTGTNFSTLRGEDEPLSGGGKSSGLMSFLKIGDRAAGAIKSGGTTRRAAKMVILDLDHPDIEEFINWKVRRGAEGRRAGRRLARSTEAPERHPARPASTAKARATTLRPGQEPGAAARDQGRAQEAMSPDNYIQRVIQLAKQGFTDIDFPMYDTDWNSKAYLTVSGQNSQQLGAHHQRLPEGGRADGDWDLTWRTEAGPRHRQDAQGPRPVGPDRPRRLGLRRPRPAVHTTINDWHTCPASGPIRGSNPCSEYMFLDDTACNLASLNLLTFRNAKTREFDVEAYEHAIRLWTVVLEISVLMAQFPSKEIAKQSLRLPHARPRLRQSRRPADACGLSYDSRSRPPDRGLAHRHHDRHQLRHLGRDGEGARPLPAATRRTASTCCGSSATTAAPPTARATATRR